MFGKNIFFSQFCIILCDFEQFAQRAIFRFDVSQQNLNNFWTDRATELRLDSKDAFFQAVSEYAFSAFRYHFQMLISDEKLQFVFFIGLSCISKWFFLFSLENTRQEKNRCLPKTKRFSMESLKKRQSFWNPLPHLRNFRWNGTINLCYVRQPNGPEHLQKATVEYESAIDICLQRINTWDVMVLQHTWLARHIMPR